ncbi:branched-chain amino acid ABC transporter permease [Rhodoligotrophos defluvii]|uniref:branched-chain amino acid ABC transporter permease n=1 Tax=Rhodoligotrophos defluvii TaxID=2561934 RepID=UPI0010C9EFAC|nr:branched-chain amino acid ABC transporter permease [Rhodoligotrophos defluvii]
MLNALQRHGSGQAETLVRAVPSTLALCLILAALPILLPMALAVDIVILAIAAVAFSLMLGQAGMLSFGQAAFFALGAYTAGFLVKSFGLSIIPALLAGAAMGGAGAAVVAFLTTRLRGVYFILMTLAFAQLVYFVALTWRDVTGGPSGLSGFSRPLLGFGVGTVSLDTSLSFYLFASAVLLVVFGLLLVILNSPVGLILRGIKENADRLEAVGYPVWRYRFFVFTVSGIMTGIAGALYAFQWLIVPVSTAAMNQSAAIAFMSILGGVGHPLGPIVGAAIYTWLSDIASSYWARWPILFGAFIILIVFFMRGGIMQGVGMIGGLFRRRWRAGRAEV